MGLVVTGISQTSDITALEAALVAAGFSLDHVQLIEPGDDTAPLAHGIVSAPPSGGLETGTGALNGERYKAPARFRVARCGRL